MKSIKFIAVILCGILVFLVVVFALVVLDIDKRERVAAFNKEEYCRSLEQEHAINKNLMQMLDIFTHGQPVLITAYNAHESQTDDTPTVTASNGPVTEGNLALSRDFLKRFDPKNDVAFGDSVWLIIHMKVDDTMNKKYLSRADVFMWDYSDAVNFGVKEGMVYHE